MAARAPTRSSPTTATPGKPAVRFVTTNPGKLREARAVFAARGVRLDGLRRELPEPQAVDLDRVARTKLAAVADLAGTILVEDSGLFIDALGGFPGVYSAPIYRLWGFGPILELLRRRPRTARFRTTVGIRWPDGAQTLVHGSVAGSIVPTPRGAHGFGFDPIFCPAGQSRTFAEMSTAEKQALSHRGRAMRRAAGLIAAAGRRRPRGRPRGR